MKIPTSIVGQTVTSRHVAVPEMMNGRVELLLIEKIGKNPPNMHAN